MTIDHDVDVVSDCVPHRRNTGLSGFDGPQSLDSRSRGHGHRFDRGKPIGDRLPSKIGETMSLFDRRLVKRLHLAAPKVAIESDEVPNASAPQLVTRLTRNLAGNIPQGDIDPRDRRGPRDPVPVPKVLPPHRLPQMLDPPWIFADEQLRQILNRRHDATRMPFERRFTPSKQARLIRDDFDEDPVSHPRMTNEGLDSLDLHTSFVDRKKSNN